MTPPRLEEHLEIFTKTLSRFAVDTYAVGLWACSIICFNAYIYHRILVSGGVIVLQVSILSVKYIISCYGRRRSI